MIKRETYGSIASRRPTTCNFPWQQRIGQYSTLLQWIIAGIVGIGLGICALAYGALPERWALLGLLAVAVPFVLMIIGQLRRPLLAIIFFDTVLQLDFNLFYQDVAAARGAIGGLSISITTMSLVGLYALWLSELLARWRSLPSYLLRMALPAAAYLAIVTLSVLAASDPMLALFEVALLLQTFLLFVYIVGTTSSRQDVIFLLTLLLICIILQSITMIITYATGQSFSIAGISTAGSKSHSGNIQNRPGGLIGSPIDAATYLSLLLAPVLSLLLTQLHWSYKWLASFTLAVGVIALVLSLSRGAWVTFLLSGLIVCLLAHQRGWLPIKIPIMFGCTILFIVIFFGGNITTRLFGDDNGSATGRIPLILLALQIIRDHSLLGVGANNYGAVVSNYLTPEFNREWIWTVHNKFLLVWAENGLVGLIAFLWFLVATMQRGWQTWQVKDRLLSPIALGIVAAIGSQTLHMMADVFHSRPQVQILWMVAALVATMMNLPKEPCVPV